MMLIRFKLPHAEVCSMPEDLIVWVERKLKTKKISQRELSRRSGVSHTLISDALRGVRPITFDFCIAVSKGLNESLWTILQMAGYVEDVPPDLLQDEEIRILINKYNSLPGTAKAVTRLFRLVNH